MHIEHRQYTRTIVIGSASDYADMSVFCCLHGVRVCDGVSEYCISEWRKWFACICIRDMLESVQCESS